MQNIQDVWIRIQETKKQQKNITQIYKDSLESSQEYKNLADKVKEFTIQKKQMEAEAKMELGAEYDKLNSLKKEIQLDKELLSDIAVSNLMKGETVKITDPENNEYEPIFSVKFKKTNEVGQKRD
jgi:methyl coenzyme M reductase subunit C-like uncharacterized protein (methanogenesis marker protein 7)